MNSKRAELVPILEIISNKKLYFVFLWLKILYKQDHAFSNDLYRYKRITLLQLQSPRDQYKKHIKEKNTYALPTCQVSHIVAIAKTNDLPGFIGIPQGFDLKPKVLPVHAW